MAATWVKSAQANPSGTSLTISVAFGSAVGAGSLLVAVCTFSPVNITPVFSDSVNGTWKAPVYVATDTPNNQSVAWSYFVNSAAGTPTVTVTSPSTLDSRGIVVSEIAGTRSFLPVIDGVPVLAFQSASINHTSDPVTVEAPGGLLIGFAGITTDDPPANISSSDLTIGANEQTVAAAGVVSLSMGHKSVSPGANTAGYTFSASQGGIIGAVVVRVGATSAGDAWVNAA